MGSSGCRIVIIYFYSEVRRDEIEEIVCGFDLKIKKLIMQEYRPTFCSVLVDASVDIDLLRQKLFKFYKEVKWVDFV